MTDDLKDIDPIIVEKILANADAFIEVDTRVDDIVAWGEQELKSREEKIKAANGTLEEFKNTAAVVSAAVTQKLQDLEKEVQARYS